MALAPGVQLGAYEIRSLLGSGGMGEVYRAKDTKLNRDVALKILPSAFALDPDRLARFKREAQVLASLNHPNIGAIYGFEDSSEVRALVLELVEGPTLADRIAQGPLPLDEALPIAKQIADALEAAHEQGIIHRDLKPANIKLRPDGAVKVLDFGLAKALEPASAAADQTSGPTFMQSPTITTPAMTMAGVILGTAAYMSPEQAKGRPADKRSDVWAFGCVLYEILAGRRAFEGEDVSDTLAAVLRAEPDWKALPAETPDHLRLLVQRCLERDRSKRVSDLSVARFLIAEPLSERRITESSVVAPVPARPRWKRALPAVASAVAAALIVGITAWRLRPAEAPANITRFTYDLPEDQRFTNPGRRVLAISPDGTRIAYVASFQLFLRSFSDAEAAPLRGTEFGGFNPSSGIASPVFSPDGQSIAFWGQGEIKRIGINGGAPVTVSRDIDNPFGMSWDGDSILVGAGRKGVLRVPAEGGSAEVLIPPSENEIFHGPQMLPDGRSILFTVATDEGLWDKARIVVQAVGSSDRKTIVEGGSDARYLPSGHIVYAVRGTLFAKSFDPDRLEAIGAPQPVVKGTARSTGAQTGNAQFDVSRTGSLVFVPGPESGEPTGAGLAIIDMKGGVQPLKVPWANYEAPRFSPNGRQLAVSIDTGRDSNVWIHDVAGANAPRQLTLGGRNRFPIWSPDGARIAFQSNRDGDEAIFWQPADGRRSPDRLTKPGPGESHIPDAFFPKGDRLLFSVRTAGGVSLWTSTTRDQKASPFIPDLFVSYPHSALSPDGQWVAYDDTGASTLDGARVEDVFVRPFPATGEIHRIATGVNPFWSPNGQSLYFATPGQPNFSVVRVRMQPTFDITQPSSIPRPPPTGGTGQIPRQYDVAPDGEHFVIVTANINDLAYRQINVVLNWLEELKTRVPVK